MLHWNGNDMSKGAGNLHSETILWKLIDHKNIFEELKNAIWLRIEQWILYKYKRYFHLVTIQSTIYVFYGPCLLRIIIIELLVQLI